MASDDEAPSAKRAKTADAAASSKPPPPLLAHNDPRRLLCTAYFECMWRSGEMNAHMPPELQEIIFDYASPSPLQLLAKDPNAVLRVGTQPTQPFLDAIREIFDCYATHETMGIKVMDADDYGRFHADPPPEKTSGFLERWGLPRWDGRKYVAFDGFVARYMTGTDDAARGDFRLFVKRFDL